jgi:predicted transcriptional regulator of viral defense system
MATDWVPESRRLAGILTAAELLRAGVTESKLRVLTGRGALVSVGHGLYARAASVNQLNAAQGGASLLAVAAAVAGAGQDAIGSHRAAATLHRLQLLRRARSDAIEVTRPRGTPGSRTARPGTRLHLAAIPAGHRTMVQGVPVTTVARTVIDVARTTSVREGVVIADSALRGRLTTKSELYAVVDACARWPGTARARQVADFSDGLAESAFESIARVAFRDSGLPAPELQASVGADGRVIARVDFYWPAHSTIAEADGAAKYSGGGGVAIRQLQRDADLRAAGFQVVHFTWPELQTIPDQVIRSIRAAFAQAAIMAKITDRQEERIAAG